MKLLFEVVEVTSVDVAVRSGVARYRWPWVLATAGALVLAFALRRNGQQPTVPSSDTSRAERSSVLAPPRSFPATSQLSAQAAAAGPIAPSPLAAASEVVPAADIAEPTPQDYIDQARAEPRDGPWADATEQTLVADLNEKAKRLDFRVGTTECFHDSCTAELFWKTLSEAREDFKAVLGQPDHTSCAPRLVLSQSGSEDAPEMGVLVLDCKAVRERAGEVRPQ